ncbi:GT2 family glycosyltransferase [Williamsia limnetica]|uniref:GT2 family glycosyltransferase n=1 Tax=Williamsia limnetica TaxID=882452 RepID=A0A318RKR1_WILLI|nr:glycosyltransferase [Williamsia limnetica]PYE15919.1 GT2 family glycosyltransferase [Williamsia limnetica]
MSVVSLGDGRVVPPDNRWDLVGECSATPRVSVVIPYYNQPRQLSLVLEALTVQTYDADQLEIVIADDGSAEPPPVDGWTSRLSVSVVRQSDKGFRAAAARNLGAAASTGSVLCFLDADTVPTPDYIRQAVRLPASAPDVLVVGRRVHADLRGVSAGTVADFFSENPVCDRSHDDREPRWLADAYDRTSNLLDPGWDGYKYVISAVFTCSRELFDDIGGFDPAFVQYGGEDWELANRAFMMGAVFAHEPAAIAWHDGPDWAGRSVPDRVAEKNAEALALAPLITDPAARTSGLRYSIPDVAVVVATDGHTAASLMRTVASVLRGVDGAVWLHGQEVESLYSAMGIDDSRVRFGRPGRAVVSRCRFLLEVSGRLVFGENSHALLAGELGPGQAGQVIVDFDGSQSATVSAWSSRARHRSRRWSNRTGQTEDDLIRTLFGVRHVTSDQVGIVIRDGDPSLSW